jgi:hypothetical protein
LASLQPPNRIERLAFPLLAVAAGSALALVLAEGFVRVFFPHARDHAITRNVLALDDNLGWKLTPLQQRHPRHPLLHRPLSN